jgi:hypothetical protein
MAIDYDGRILAQAAPGAGEQIVIAPIHIEQLRYERNRRQGHALLAHRRTELYSEQRKPAFPGSPASGDRTVEQLNQTISRIKDGMAEKNRGT